MHQLTGEALSADAWVYKLQESVGSMVQQEEQDYQQAVQKGPKLKPGQYAAYAFPYLCATLFMLMCT